MDQLTVRAANLLIHVDALAMFGNTIRELRVPTARSSRSWRPFGASVLYAEMTFLISSSGVAGRAMKIRSYNALHDDLFLCVPGAGPEKSFFHGRHEDPPLHFVRILRRLARLYFVIAASQSLCQISSTASPASVSIRRTSARPSSSGRSTYSLRLLNRMLGTEPSSALQLLRADRAGSPTSRRCDSRRYRRR